MNKKNIAIVAAIALVVGAVAGGTAIYLLGDDEGTTTVATTSADTGTVDTGTGETVCPADVRKCVDGSFVGRAGPDCEFTPCPEPPPLQQAENIKVYTPLQGARINSPVIISGEARVFEGTVNYRVLDDNGTVIDEGFTTAASMEVGQFGPFSAIADFDDPQTGIGRIEVFNLSARDGSVENLVTVLVRFL